MRSIRITTRLCRLLLRILNVRCTLRDESGGTYTGLDRTLILPNHVSYLDAILVNAFIPSVFVTSNEIREAPGLGHMTRAAGCAFVERRHKGEVHRDVDKIATLLNAGLNVTLFPEGSTSPGDRLLDFKKTLLEAAVRSRCRVAPAVIRYTAIDGKAFDVTNRDAVAWYGDMTFLPHLLRLAATRSVDVELTIMATVPFRSHRSRKLLADEVKSRIAARLQVAP